MADNILKGTIKIDAPGVKETFAQVEQGVSNMQKKLGGVPSAAQQSADGLVTAFAKVSNIEIPPVKVDAEVGAINVPEVGIAPVKIPVTANTDAAKASLDNLGSSIKPLAIHLDTTEAQTKAKLLEGTIETLEGRLGAKKDLIRFVDPGEITKLAKLNKEIQDLEKEIARLKNIGKQGFDDLGNKIDAYGNHLNTLSKRSAVATQSTINLGRVIQDAPYGFIGVANNLNPLLEGFQRLRAETGSAGGALKALGGSLMGAGGVGLAISVVSSLLVVFGDKLFGAGKSAEQQTSRIDQLKKSLNDLKAVTSSEILGSATGEFSKAVSVIETLRQNVDLAKKGFIDKKDVVNQYNKELGDTIGKVQTLDEVEKTIASKGNAYLQFTLLKAAAQEALKKASEAALQAAENEAKATDISSGAITKAAQKGLKDLPGVAGATALDKFNKATQKSVSEINKTVVQANQQKDKFINIFKDFQTRAAEIAKNNKFKFDVDIIPGTAEKQKFEFLYDFLPFDPSGKLKPEEKSKLLENINKFSKEFQGIFKGVSDLVIGSDQQRIQKAIQFDLNLKAGKVQLDLTKLREETDKAIKPENIIPESTVGEIDKTIVDKFIRGFQNASETLKSKNLFGDFDLTPTIESALSDAKLQLKRIGQELPKVFEGKDIFGNARTFTFEELFDFTKISPADAIRAIQNATGNVKTSAEQLQTDLQLAFSNFKVDAFAGIGESIGQAIASGGSFIDVASKSFASTLGSFIELIGKDLIKYGVIKTGLDKILAGGIAIPGAAAIALGVIAVAVGAAMKSSFANVSGSHASGLKRVPKDGYIAELHKDEMVVPAKQSEKLRSIMGPDFSIPSLDKLAGSIGSANIKSSLPSFKGIQIPNIQVSQLRAPSIPSTNLARFNNSNLIGMGSRSLEVNLSGELTARGDHMVSVINKTNRKQKIAF